MPSWLPFGLDRVAMTPGEDAVSPGADKGGGDEEEDGEQHLALQELHDPENGDDHAHKPKSHGVPSEECPPS